MSRSHRGVAFEKSQGYGDFCENADPAPILRIRRLIQAGDLDQASAAARDLAPIADHHDAGTLAALWGLCGIGAREDALAVLDGHTARVGWVVGADSLEAAA